FYPQTVAIVGASGSDFGALPSGGFIRNFQKLGFEGRIYPVNPRLKEMLGLSAYPNLISIPESLDLVIICTPAREVPAVLEDCIAANAKNIHIFSAGFGESGEKEGAALEEKIREIALQGELRVVGPNCMGINVPRAMMQTIHEFPIHRGNVAFLSQSGGHAIQFTGYAAGFGIGFSKIISYGNGCIMDSPEFLEYLATDPETSIITMYLEGVQDGRKLIKKVSEINPTKPVIVWKGGKSEWGSRAASSHTGSLAGNRAVWDSFFKQTGAVSVNSLDELADVTMTFLYLTPPPGKADWTCTWWRRAWCICSR
ncbi:CoA-binding protein, partial [Chloroflexota bacterium]